MTGHGSVALTAGGLLAMALAMQAQAGGDPAAGESKAAQCTGCHGTNGQGNPANPALAGRDAGYLKEQLQAYKSGTRQHGMMNMMAKKLSDQDIADLAAYYASLLRGQRAGK